MFRWRRRVTITFPDGRRLTGEWEQQKHPPSADEMRSWVEACGLVIGQFWGDYGRTPYSGQADRVIIWAVKA